MVKKLTPDLDQHSKVFYIKNMVKLEILENICIIIICFPVDDVISFVINLSFLIKLFSYMTENIIFFKRLSLKQIKLFWKEEMGL